MQGNSNPRYRGLSRVNCGDYDRKYPVGSNLEVKGAPMTADMQSGKKFEKWFREQFGKPPSKKTIQQLRDERTAHLRLFQEAENELLNLTDYDRRKDAAFKAWLAKSSLP